MGTIPGEEETTEVHLTWHDGVLHGTLARYGANQHIEYRTLSDGSLMVRQLDESTMTDVCGDPGAGGMDPTGGLEAMFGEEATATAIAGDTAGWTTIDVVAGYGIEARQADGGVTQIEARIINAVDRMNTAFQNSAITDTEIMLLGLIEDPDYDFPGATSGSMSSGDELGNLNNLSDGVLDTVSDYATALGADLRAFIVKQADGSAGIAYRPGRSSITGRDYLTSTRITFAHELGHNLGCDHSWGDSSQNNSSYNYGWRLDPPANTRVRTIMAYDWSWGSGHRIPYYANPAVSYQDAPTGAANGHNVLDDIDADTSHSVSDQRYLQGGLGYSGSDSSKYGFDGNSSGLGARNGVYIAEVASSRASYDTRESLSVVTPASGATWNVYSSYEIYWIGGDYRDSVSLSLYKNGSLHSSIASGSQGEQRKYSWTVPDTVPTGSDYSVRVDLGGGTTVDSSTVALWFKADNASASGVQMLFEEGGGTNGLNIYLRDGNLYVGVWAGSTYSIFLSTPAPTDGAWHHVAAVLDGSSSIGYLDGSAFDTNTGAGSLPSHSDDTGIGAVNGATKLDSGSNGAFAGLIDDVLLYNRSLSASDLSALVGQVLLVAAGADTSGTVNNAIALAGSSNGSSQTWTKVSGTGNVVFGNASAASTTATMDAGGSYVLRLTGSDGTTTIYDEVTVTVGANNPPVIAQGSSVSATMDEDASPTVWTAPTVTASDSDGDTLTWSLLSDGSKGSATVSGTGTSPITFLYAPSANANGSDSFVIQVSDGTATDSITVNVTITPRNDAPVIAQGASVGVVMSEDGSPTPWSAPTVTASDIDGDTLTWSVASGPSMGSANVSGTGASPSTFTYTPNAGVNGSDSFVVQVSDGTTTDTITVNVSIGGVNDAPVIAQGASVSATMDEDASPTVWTAPAVSASDPDGDTLTWSLVSDGSKGSATVSGTGASPATFLYAPSPNANGSDSFVIQVSDGVVSDSITVNVTITPQNDAPTIDQGASTTVVMSEDGSPTAWAAPSLSATDIDGDSLTWSLATAPTSGNATVAGTGASPSTLSYTPNANANGDDSFVVQVSDGTASASITVTVTRTPTNDAPTFGSAPVLGGSVGQAYSYAVSAGDIDGDSLSFTLPTKPAWLNLADNGNGTATLSGTPAIGNAGANAVVIRVSDGTTTVDQSFSVEVVNALRVITMGTIDGNTWTMTPAPAVPTPTDNGNGQSVFDPVDSSVDHQLSTVPNGNG